MSLFDEEANLADLPDGVKDDLIEELSVDSAWKAVANYRIKNSRIFSPSFVKSLEREGNLTNGRRPAELLIDELNSGFCSVGNMCKILRDCNLLDALNLLHGYEPLVIKKEPNSNGSKKQCQPAFGESFILTCEAAGLPPPRYQWFHGNVPLQDQTTNTLNVTVISPDQEGDYRCTVSQYSRDEELLDEKNTKSVSLMIKPVPVVISKQPESVVVTAGDSFVISCEATGYPAPRYQWWKRNTELKGMTSNILRKRNVKLKDGGEYRCYVTNDVSDAITNMSKVTVEPPHEKAGAKIALLIGNCDYENKDKLIKPVDDVANLGKKLEEIGFYVTYLRNLTLDQMRKAIKRFSEALVPDVYGFFYFAGHGFAMHDSYMEPIDISKPITLAGVFSESELLQLTLDNEPALLVVILDMCRIVLEKEENEEIFQQIPEIRPHKNNQNFLIAHSTCNFEPSYESSFARNGVYASHLIKHITTPKPVIDLFQAVAKCVSRKNICGSRQTPQFTPVLMKDHRLTDAIDHSLTPIKAVENFKELTTFRPITRDIALMNNAIWKLVVDRLNPPFLGGLRIMVLNVENYHVSFTRYDKRNQRNVNQDGIYINGAECYIPEAHRHGPEAILLIEISSIEGQPPLLRYEFRYTDHDLIPVLKLLND